MLFALAVLSGCGGDSSSASSSTSEAPPSEPAPASTVGDTTLVAGTWAGALTSRGGPIAFRMELGEACTADLHVAERTFPAVATCTDDTLTLRVPPYDGVLTASISDDGQRLRGQWVVPKGGGAVREVAFEAVPADGPRQYDPVPDGLPGQVTLGLSGKKPVVLELNAVEGPENAVYATVSSPTGDWGPLEGGFQGAELVLTGFDGSHAFRMELVFEDGALSGQVWSKDAPPRQLTPSTETVDLDGWDDLSVERVDLAGIQLPRVEAGGTTVQPLPVDGPRIVHFTGTWCPNCNDQAPVLEALAENHPGITLVGLSYEAGAPPAKADRQILKFKEKFGVAHDIYRLDRALPFLDPVPAWPTTLFVKADGTVSAAHVGFLGPSSSHYDALVERYREEAAKLVE